MSGTYIPDGPPSLGSESLRFQAALHGKHRGKPFDEVQQELRNNHDEQQLDSAFRQGYERGRRYQVTVVESYKA